MVESGSGARPAVLLIVDDEPDILETLKELVESTMPEARVRTASSGAEGLALLANGCADGVVSDFRMPGMDGVEFLRRARELCPGMITYILTAYATEDLLDRAVREAAVAGVLSKTGDPERLARDLAGILEAVRPRAA